MLPFSLDEFSVVGFSGSRSVVPSVFPAVVSAVPAGASVFVGDAGGVDAAARTAFPAARVFRVSGAGRWAFAARSTAFVRALASAGGCLLSFSARSCPSGVRPCSYWRSAAGSGSWGSLALAVGLEVPCFVFLPPSVPSPEWLRPLGGGWFVSCTAPVQLSLF
jgi:hypothetical protein